MFDLKPGSFVWDAAAQRVLMVDLNSCIEAPQGRSIGMTWQFAAPELLVEPRVGDARSDVYSLGLVFMNLAVRWSFSLPVV